jgi:hypothetical protein
MFLDLQAEPAKRGAILRLVEAIASVRDVLRIDCGPAVLGYTASHLSD